MWERRAACLQPGIMLSFISRNARRLLDMQVGGGTFTLRGDLWVQNTFDVQPNRRLTIRSGELSTLHRQMIAMCCMLCLNSKR